MSELYNRFAGQSLERLNTLSDGIFAVAMTLLVLNLRLPGGNESHASEQALRDVLRGLAPNAADYLLTFTMLGTFWLAQHTLLSLIDRTDRNLAWIQIGFLFLVTVLPFSTSLLAGFERLRLAVGVYWLNIFLLGVGLAVSAWYVSRAGLLVGPDARQRLAIFRRRTILAQVLYSLAALVCIINTRASVVALALVQFYFIVSPRIRWLDRLATPPEARG